MFPIRDENPKLHSSVITYSIIIVNALVWIIFQHAGSGSGFMESLVSYGLIPGELLGTLPAGTTP